MSENTNSETSPAPGQAPESGGRTKLFIIIIIVLILVGGGSSGYFYLSGKAATSAGDEETGSKKKKSIKDDLEEELPADEAVGQENKSKSGSYLKNAIPDDENVKNVVELSPFIVNLADQEQARYLRMTVSIGLGGDDKEVGSEPIFITRVRNAMLAVLSEKTSEDVLTVEGKSKLRKELLRAARAASSEPQVEAIYITDFIVQL